MTKKVDYFTVIHRYIKSGTKLYRVYVPHVVLVTHEALVVGRRMGFSEEQLRFVEEAGMLHDIGVCRVEAPDIGAEGDLPYIKHILAGREILESEGLPRHALAAERHVGTGITKEEIKKASLPLPARDILPQTIEEKVISWADLFYGKDPSGYWYRQSMQEVTEKVKGWGEGSWERFQDWWAEFG